ncbi:hypothetical protein K9M48_02900 [Candidatus Gracilibacteria bacterium]|nr:hypothetical protein [Candidatus Gracilibacteria bacterium]
MSFYKLASITKLILGILILILVYSYINVYEDPSVGLSLAFLGLFITLRGLSFFIFILAQNFFRSKKDKDRVIKDSYKLSLLFGIYAIINVLLIVLGTRNKILGIVLLIGFVLIQILLFSDKTNDYKHQTSG